MQEDWKVAVEKEAEGLVEKMKEISSSDKWVANGNKPCEMFKMDIENNLGSKGVAVLEFPFEQVIKFFSDSTASKKINDSLVKFECLHHEEGKYKVIHMEHKAVWPVWNRDFVTVATRKQEGDTYYIVSRSCSYPLPEVQGVVRGEIHIAGYIIQKIDEKTTRVTYLASNDPKGAIPGMVKNTLASKQGGVAAKIGEIMKKQGY